MTKTILTTAAFLIVAATANAQSGSNKEMETMMKAWEAYATPGDAHKELAKEVGAWTTESTMWMMPNDPKPMKTTGTAEIKMAYGDRYQIGTHKGDFMGMPFEGTSTVGYNNASKKWESTWIDNMGTGVMFMSGVYDPKTKTSTFVGRCTDPITGKEKSVRETYTIVDDNTRKMTMYDTDEKGKEYKTMEMTMKRR